MADDGIAPEHAAERLLAFYDAVRGAAAPPPRAGSQRQVTDLDIRLRREAPPPEPEEVLVACATCLSHAERAELVRLLDKMRSAVPRPHSQ